MLRMFSTMKAYAFLCQRSREIFFKESHRIHHRKTKKLYKCLFCIKIKLYCLFVEKNGAAHDPQHTIMMVLLWLRHISLDSANGAHRLTFIDHSVKTNIALIALLVQLFLRGFQLSVSIPSRNASSLSEQNYQFFFFSILKSHLAYFIIALVIHALLSG